MVRTFAFNEPAARCSLWRGEVAPEAYVFFFATFFGVLILRILQSWGYSR